MTEPLLSIRSLSKAFSIRTKSAGKASLKAVEAIDLDIMEGETLGLVGESGCGKSTLGRLILRLIEPSTGHVSFAGKELTTLNHRDMIACRKHLQIVFQDPFASLNPRMTIGTTIRRNLDIHNIGTKKQRRRKVDELLLQVGLLPEHAGRYPHEFSGGQRQRVAIARALATDPKLIVADEPTSALDVSVQAQILKLLIDLRTRLRLTLLFISHDMGVIRHVSDRVAVMYLGKIIEIGPKESFFANPLHPYSIALQSSVPIPDPQARQQLKPLEGEVPSPINPPKGCRFHPRCPHRLPKCSEREPPLMQVEDRKVACFLY